LQENRPWAVIKTIKKTTTFLIALLTAGPLFAADTNTTSQVGGALAKLKSATNYSWTAVTKIPNLPFEPGPVQGRAQKGGYAMVTQQFNDNTLEAVFKGDKAAVKNEGEWQNLDDAEGMPAMMGGWLTASGTAADEAGKLLKNVPDLKAGDGGELDGDFTPEGATELLTYHPRGGEPTHPKNAKGSVKFWLKDGALTKFESHLTGKVAFGPDQDEQDFEITRTVEIKDVGTTKLEVPADALKKLEPK
jgi:hypothetical protein